MNTGYRQKQHRNQRGAIGHGPDDLPDDVSSVSLADLMHQLEGLEARLSRLKTGLTNLVQLQQLEADAPAADSQAAAQEIVRLQEAVDVFELEIAHRAVNWQHLQEPFWQAVRFGGLGIGVGWLLAWLAGI